MKKILLSLLILCTASAIAAPAGTKTFGKVKAKDEILVGVEGKVDIDIEDGYKVNQMMAGFVYKSFDVNANSTMSNEYVWVEKLTSSTATIRNLHIFGKHRYNICVSNKWVKGFASVIVHMPKADPAYASLYDWHLLYVNPDEQNFPNVIYYKKEGDGISYVTPTKDDPFSTLDCKAYFCSFVEFCGKGRYLTVSMEMP